MQDEQCATVENEHHLANHCRIFFLLIDACVRVSSVQCEIYICMSVHAYTSWTIVWTYLIPSSFCVCVCVCGLLWGANGFQLPSNTVKGAYRVYESVCVLCSVVEYMRLS